MTRSGDELLRGTVPAFLVGLVVVVGAGTLVGQFTESHLAVAFAAYFLTTVFDIAVERNRYREDLLEQVGVTTASDETISEN
jgi:hypothetical protein